MANVKEAARAKTIFDLAPVRTAVSDIPQTVTVQLVPFDGRGRRDSFRFDLDSYGTMTVFAYGDARDLDGLEFTAGDLEWATQDPKRMVKGSLDRRQNERDGYAVYVTMPFGVGKSLLETQAWKLTV